MAGALVFLVEAVSRQTVLGSLWWLASSPVPALLNLLLAGLLMALLAALAGNMRWGAVASVVLLLLAAAVHGGKQLVLGEPLYPWDLLLTRETAHVFGRGYFPFHWPMVAVCLVLAVLAVLLAGRLSRRRIPLWRRAVLAVSLCGVLAAMTFYRSWPLRRVMDSLVTNYFWDQGRNYRSNGFLLTFLINTQASMVLPPDDYSADRMAGLAERLDGRSPAPPPSTQAEPPGPVNLIVVLSESFWDATALPNVRFEPDPLANFRRLSQAHTRLELVSPVFGGLTCNAEFELLTGLPMIMFPKGAIPYQQYISRPMPSLASLLRDRGYRTIAVHPFHRWFWNRDRVFELMGFERFMALDDYADWRLNGDYVGDDSLTDKIIAAAEGLDGPFFLFAVSMQNHGPYEDRHFEPTAGGLDVTGDLPAETLRTVANMAAGLQVADAALARLVEHFQTRGRPTMIVFLGDHLPHLGQDYELYRQCGLVRPASDLSREEVGRLHTVPGVIWTNYPAALAQPSRMSISFLPLEILDRMGLDDAPPAVDLLRQVRGRYPVLTEQLIMADDQPLTDWPKDDPLLQELWLLQYDLLFGQQHSLDRLYRPPGDKPLGMPHGGEPEAPAVNPVVAGMPEQDETRR